MSERKRYFDPTVNLGHILTILSLGLALGAGYTGLVTRIAELEFHIGEFAEDYKKLEGKFDRLENRVRLLEINK